MSNLLGLEPATLTIEADTVEDALARLAEEIGPDARIVKAERIRKGGFAGFFAREMVELVAELGPSQPPTAAEMEGELDGGVESMFARMLSAAEGEDAFAAGEDDEPAPRRALPGARWTEEAMLSLGLPRSLVESLSRLDPTDDIGHLLGLAEAIAEISGPIPDGPHRFVGDRVEHIKAATGIPGGPGPLHVVVGDELPETLPAAPKVVSWCSERGAVLAIALALGTGATLGYGITGRHTSGTARRVGPLDAAIVIRNLVERS